MNAQEKAQQQIIDEYELNREQNRAAQEAHINACLEALKPVIEDNKKYLRYAMAKGWLNLNNQEIEETATLNAVVHITGRTTHWDHAHKLAFEVLQDANHHEDAEKVAKLFELELRADEVE